MADTPLHIPALVARGKFKDRRPDIWGDSYGWSWVRPTSQLKYVVIHHSVTSHDATPDDIALLHKARGWGGIGYHFVIDKQGVVHYVGDISTARANVLDMNEQVLGVCMIGDFTKHLPSDEQIISAHELASFFFFETPSIPSLKGWDQLVGHKDLQATACPGSSWPTDMRDRIINKIPYTPAPIPPEPPEPPAPEPPPEPTPPPVEPEPVPPTPPPGTGTPPPPSYKSYLTRIKVGLYGNSVGDGKWKTPWWAKYLVDPRIGEVEKVITESGV